MSIYADTSFFVSVYVTDRHSQEARQRVSSQPAMWFTPLHRAEWEHAVAQHVFRGEMNLSEAERTYDRLESDCRHSLWLLVDLPTGILEAAVHLARTHVARIGARTLDTLHVASALELKAKYFWTFDDRQAKLAKAAGLKVS